MSTLDWIAVDGGGDGLRVWGMAGARVLHQARSDQRADSLAQDGFETALLALVDGWLPEGRATPVLACGMVDARQAGAGARYRRVPCAPLGDALAPVPMRDLRLSVQLVPGLQQPRPADVMNGDETRIAGFLAQHPGWDGVVCLPGGQSRWVHLSAGEVISFQTFLTGEIFALLSQHPVLRHAVTTSGATEDSGGFTEGLDQGLERPEWLLSRLFSIRAEGVLAGLTPAQARARLSGLLIGAEIAGARPYWLGQRVAILGESGQARLYAHALTRLSVPVSTHDAGEMALAGLATARAKLPRPKGT